MDSKVVMRLEHTIFRAERKAKAIDLLGGICANCGVEQGLEFDHVRKDRVDGGHCISRMYAYSWQKIVDELRKCQLLCRSCHIKKTMGETGKQIESAHGTASRYNNQRCRCYDCTGAWRDYKKERRHAQVKVKLFCEEQ